MNPAVNTNRIYRFEWNGIGKHPFNRKCSIDELRTIAKKLWSVKNKRKFKELEIVCGRGTMYNGRLLSYCQYDNKVRIVLARNQRDIVTLVHEIVHGQGYEDHGPGFVRKMLYYLVYLGCDKKELTTLAKQYKLAGV